MHQLHGDVVDAAIAPEVVDLGDVGVVELDRDLRLVDEHADELAVLGDVGEDALDRHLALEAGDSGEPGAEHLGHASGVDALEQRVTPELRVRQLVLGHLG